MNPAVLETFQKYRSALRPVNCLIPQNFHIEQRVASDELRTNQARLAQGSLLNARRFSAAERIFLPLQHRKALGVANSQELIFTARAETEDDRLEKDHLEVLRLTHKPFAKRCPRM
jgi:hypothetical protein